MTEAIRGNRLDEVDVALTMTLGPEAVPRAQSGDDELHDAVVRERPAESPKSHRHERQAD
jgi:hypothetical protein